MRRWSEDDAASMGAALAFYALFSMAPLLLLVISIASLVVDAEAARSVVFDELGELLGERGAAAVRALLAAADRKGQGIAAASLSILMLIVGATSVFAELRRDLDRIWRHQAPPTAGWRKLLGPRLSAFGLVLAIGFLLVVSLALSAAVSALGSLWGTLLPGSAILLRIADFVVSVGLMTGLFAMTYRILPSVRIEWRDVWVGAGVTSLLFWVGKWLIGLYIAKSAVASPFGAAGTLVVVIVWVYYSAQVFFLGAEFTRAYAARGTRMAGAMAPVPNGPGRTGSSP